jgi:ADP-ribose pyrophosphatase YjhB (NUDIX family)
VHVFLVRGGEVLLLRRANTDYEDGKWSVPAGHVEPGETATDAALRETLEEVGVRLSRDRLRFAGAMHRQSRETRVDFFFRCELEPSDPAPRNLEPAKCSELGWAKVGEPPSDTIPYVRAALANLVAGIWFDEHGWPLRSSAEEEVT